MTGRRMVMGLLAAVTLGLFVGMLGGEPRQVSVEMWLVTATAWLGWIVIGEATAIAPVRPDRLGAFGRRYGSPEAVDTRPRLLANLEGLLANATRSRRAATIRLRPRLVTATTELLRTRHGIDVAREPERRNAVLGDVAWVVDPEVALHRPPTAAEIDRLLRRAMAEESTGE